MDLEQDFRFQELLNGGDCRAHFHLEDRIPRQDFLHGLQNVAYKYEVSSDTVLTGQEDFIFVNTASSNVTITLPRATGGREITVVKIASANTLTVNTTSPDLIDGSASQSYTTQWLARTYKQTSTGWTIVWGYLEDGYSQTFPYGAFQDNTSQYDGSSTIPYAMRLNTPDYSNGVTVLPRQVVSASSIGPASTTLTCTAITSGRFYPGMLLSGTGVTSGTYIYLQLSSTAAVTATHAFVSGGGAGTNTVVLNSVTGVEDRQFISGTGVPANTRVVAVNSTTKTVTLSANFTVQAAGNYAFRPWGYQGTYSVSPSQTVASTTISGSAYTKITALIPGLYNLQFSAQFTNTDTQIHDVDVWFKKNDVTIPNSNSQFSVPNKHGGINGHLIAGLNFFIQLSANDCIEIVWHTDDPSVYIEAIPEQTSPVRPAVPSVIATMTFVSKV